MKATMSYNLPDDENEFLIAVRAMSWALVAWDLDQFLRDKLKYGHEYKSADEALEQVREKLHEILEDHNINLDEIR